ncbi:transcription antitermination factor NusB [Fundidesulfovibrio butyratiphilus]
MSRVKPVLPPSRRAALAALDAIFPSGKRTRAQDAQEALDHILPTCHDPRDKRLATELVYGTLRLMGRYDFLARSLLAKPEKTPPQVLRILTVALHELTQLDHVPPHATLSWAVDAAKVRVGAFAGSLVNGVLRAAQRLGDVVNDPEYYRRDACAFDVFVSRYASAPLWLTRMLVSAFGEEKTLRLLETQLRPAPLGLRVNASKPGALELFQRLSSAPGAIWSDFPALAFSSGSQPLPDEEFSHLEASGLVSRQSAAVHRALSILGASLWPEPVYDACAGRGGKTAWLLEAGKRLFAASDRNRRRLRGLRRELHRLSLPEPSIFVADATHFALRNKPSTILLDAPCSGMGVLARRPDAKWKRSPDDLADLTRLQEDILEACLAELPAGGVLAYLTCTILPQENEIQAARLEHRHGLTTLAQVDENSFYDLGEFFWGKVWKKPG